MTKKRIDKSTLKMVSAVDIKISKAMLLDLCGKAAPIAAIFVFMAPIPTIRRVSEEKSVGNLPLLPYSSMISSAFVWVVYGKKSMALAGL